MCDAMWSGVRPTYSSCPDLYDMDVVPLTENNLVSRTNPFLQFQSWFDDAFLRHPLTAKDACLATSTKLGVVSNRMVQLDSFNEDGFVFFTSSEGRKGRELAENPRCAMTFYWPDHMRQVRIEGMAHVLPDERSEQYFRNLPFENQIAISVAPQSREVPSREALDEAYRDMADMYKGGDPVPRPSFWNAYLIVPTWVEFYRGHPNFLSDRLVFTRQSEGHQWDLKRLAA